MNSKKRITSIQRLWVYPWNGWVASNLAAVSPLFVICCASCCCSAVWKSQQFFHHYCCRLIFLDPECIFKLRWIFNPFTVVESGKQFSLRELECVFEWIVTKVHWIVLLCFVWFGFFPKDHKQKNKRSLKKRMCWRVSRKGMSLLR